MDIHEDRWPRHLHLVHLVLPTVHLLATFAACESPRVSGRHARVVPTRCSTAHGREVDSVPSSFLLAKKAAFGTAERGAKACRSTVAGSVHVASNKSTEERGYAANKYGAKKDKDYEEIIVWVSLMCRQIHKLLP